ncbi:hypothetical protein GCM10009682_35960 [Luedemannella flava]|uniref:Nitrate/nitrite sensing protein domain-containing protein n=1 Tax=Luedemannella flava TaxID=349316 RepID=A0ABN2M647_9ACTN
MVKLATPWGIVRAAVSAACVVAIAASFIAVLRQSSAATDADAAVVLAERQGVVYLHPLTTLIGELVEAQSAAVRAEKVDVEKVRKALDGVSRADAGVGSALGTRQRFIDLLDKVNGVLDSNLTGRPAYEAYTDVMLLLQDLARRVGDSSNLVHDPDLDSYYLMKAALEQLPTAIINAGRAADLVALNARDGRLAGEAEVQVAVARFGVAQAAEQVSAGMNVSIDATQRDELGAQITPRLDAFRNATNTFAPSTMLAEFAQDVDGKVLAAAAHEVFTTALPLAHKLLSELDEVLAMRERALTEQRRSTVWSIVIVSLSIFVIFWVVVLSRRRPGRRGTAVKAPPANATDGLALGSVGDLRRLLDEELVDSGYRGKGRGRGRGDAQ